MAVREKGGMWCDACAKPVTARKTGRRVRNTASIGGAIPTGGLSLLFARSDQWHCSVCGGPVRRAPAATRQPTAAGSLDAGPETLLRLLDPGPKKIAAIKAVRAEALPSLHAAKAFVDSAPSEITIPEQVADRLADGLRAAGAMVELHAVPGDDDAPTHDLAGQLERLAGLRADGSLDAHEFEAAKSRLLAEQ